MKFGFLIDKKEFKCDDFSITIVPDYEETCNWFYEFASVSNGWVYGQKKHLNKTDDENKKFKQVGPTTCCSFYQMPITHEIKSIDKDEEYLRFLILGYGFLQGLYLTPEGYSYLGRIPYKPGKLHGLLLLGEDYMNGMERINFFYKSSDAEKRKRMYAAMHWFLLSQSYDFEWDRFDAQYKVLDGIYNICKSSLKDPASNHAGRPVALAKEYGIKLPQWAELDSSGNKSRLSILRNELVHEAKYAGHPIGYSYPSENYSFEFTSFNSKLIAAALGIDTPYLQADPNDRCTWRWNIRK